VSECDLDTSTTRKPRPTRADEPLKKSFIFKSCKYLRIILRSDLRWADQVNYTVKKAWKALHFTMRIIKKGNSNTKSLAYMSLVRPILEFGAACWDPYREGQITAKESGQICTSYEQFELGKFGIA
jgi:hypothetical protein